MAKISIRNLNSIGQRDNELYQALSDLLDHVSSQKSTIQTLQTQVAALQKQAK